MLCICENNTFVIFSSMKITACDNITLFKRINLQCLASFSVLLMYLIHLFIIKTADTAAKSISEAETLDALCDYTRWRGWGLPYSSLSGTVPSFLRTASLRMFRWLSRNSLGKSVTWNQYQYLLKQVKSHQQIEQVPFDKIVLTFW